MAKARLLSIEGLKPEDMIDVSTISNIAKECIEGLDLATIKNPLIEGELDCELIAIKPFRLESLDGQDQD